MTTYKETSKISKLGKINKKMNDIMILVMVLSFIALAGATASNFSMNLVATSIVVLMIVATLWIFVIATIKMVALIIQGICWIVNNVVKGIINYIVNTVTRLRKNAINKKIAKNNKKVAKLNSKVAKLNAKIAKI